jgi:hypothetical protein
MLTKVLTETKTFKEEQHERNECSERKGLECHDKKGGICGVCEYEKIVYKSKKKMTTFKKERK